MKKVIVIGCFIAGFLLLIPPCVNAVGYDAVQSSIEKNVEPTSANVHVYGGLGIHIDVGGVSKDTVVGTTVKGIIATSSVQDFDWPDEIRISIMTVAPFPSTFQLYITVNEQLFSYEGRAFLCFVWGIKGISI